nr:hypothetical protein [Tanacetum cinerariifolium]GFA71847.1 hypothetical protein [Tanacetum cinerariifolium]
MAKTINGEVQIHARVDGKEIVITESSVRRDLQLAYEEGIDCFPNSTIFEQLALMGKPKTKDTQVPQPSGPTKSVTDEAVYRELGDSLVMAVATASSLKAEQACDEAVYRELGDSLVMAAATASSLKAEQACGAKKPYGILLLKLAKIDADHQLAERLQAQEQEVLSDAKKATLFQQLL